VSIPDLRIERAGADDAPALSRIHLTARAAAGDAFPPAAHADEWAHGAGSGATPKAAGRPCDGEYLPHLLRDVLPHAEVWIARRAEEGVGMLVLEGDLLDDLYVLPAAQGTGVGSALLAHAKRLRPGGLELWVFTSNRPARAFYRRHGFELVGGTSGANEERAPDLRLRWRPTAEPGSAR
jgi:GNAT superfamily N-acetyltransferase